MVWNNKQKIKYSQHWLLKDGGSTTFINDCVRPENCFNTTRTFLVYTGLIKQTFSETFNDIIRHDFQIQNRSLWNTIFLIYFGYTHYGALPSRNILQYTCSKYSDSSRRLHRSKKSKYICQKLFVISASYVYQVNLSTTDIEYSR